MGSIDILSSPWEVPYIFLSYSREGREEGGDVR
jgi:hypothetical protein